MFTIDASFTGDTVFNQLERFFIILTLYYKSKIYFQINFCFKCNAITTQQRHKYKLAPQIDKWLLS